MNFVSLGKKKERGEEGEGEKERCARQDEREEGRGKEGMGEGGESKQASKSVRRGEGGEEEKGKLREMGKRRREEERERQVGK